jgi:hypothetical protein
MGQPHRQGQSRPCLLYLLCRPYRPCRPWRLPAPSLRSALQSEQLARNTYTATNGNSTAYWHGPAAPAGPVAPVAPVSPLSPLSPLAPAGPVGPIGPAKRAISTEYSHSRCNHCRDGRFRCCRSQRPRMIPRPLHCNDAARRASMQVATCNAAVRVRFTLLCSGFGAPAAPCGPVGPVGPLGPAAHSTSTPAPTPVLSQPRLQAYGSRLHLLGWAVTHQLRRLRLEAQELLLVLIRGRPWGSILNLGCLDSPVRSSSS